MVACFDTNVLLPMLGLRHPLGAILDAWVDGRFHWAVTNEILTEYEEIVSPRIGRDRWNDFILLLELGEDQNQNLLRIHPSFRFNVVKTDPDDNKFVDCAVTADADWLVTYDRHFDVLKNAGYRPQPIAPEDFVKLMI